MVVVWGVCWGWSVIGYTPTLLVILFNSALFFIIIGYDYMKGGWGLTCGGSPLD